MPQRLLPLLFVLLVLAGGLLAWNDTRIRSALLLAPSSTVPAPLSEEAPVLATTTPVLSVPEAASSTPLPPALISAPKKQNTPTVKKETPPAVKETETLPPVAVTPGALMRAETPPAPEASSSASTVASPPRVVSLSALTPEGILAILNAERLAIGLSPLVLNRTLTVIAEVKSADMITKQYFAHEAPDGTDIGILAARYQYEYLRVGENLAMGDFTSDADVMAGWMNSPGHRANILNPEYTEVGIAALEGMHDGRLMWYAVQEFGRPASLCPKPDALLGKKITLYQEQLNTLEQTLTTLRAKIDAGGSDREVVNAQVKDYNTIVELYNNLIAMTKDAVETYNGQVSAYNSCIE